MRVRLFRLFCFIGLVLLCSCRVTKFVPDGQYLLDKVEIRSSDPDIKKDELKKYVRQTPNSSVFGIWRMQLRLYSTAGRDTAKWHNRVLMRAGEAPVIYNPTQTFLSEQSLGHALANRGYMHAKVASTVKLDRKRARVTYHIDPGTPYRVGSYTTDSLPHTALLAVAGDSTASLVRPGMLFDVDVLNAERDRISRDLREEGYYKFNKEMLTYVADSALNNRHINLEMHLAEMEDDKRDSLQATLFSRYHVRHVTFFNSRNVGLRRPDAFSTDTADFRFDRRDRYFLVSDSDKEDFLRLGTLIDNTFILPGERYSDTAVERTYTALNALSPVKYVNISFRETHPDSLDCFITVAPAKLFSLTGEVEATYTDGFWGVAANLGTTHRNLFHGAETLSLQGRLAYEWQGEGVLANELGVQAGLLFPNFLMPFTSDRFRRSIRANTEFTADVNYQNRPEEFSVMRFGVGMKYGWSRPRLRHALELLDISYVDFNVTDTFRKNFLETNKFNPYNYESHLITRLAYTGSFSTFHPNRPLRNHVALQYGIETAGNVLYGFNRMLGGRTNEDGAYTIVGNIPYSQYVRADFNVTFHHIIDAGNRFVYHLFAGAGVPYGNGSVIPYERRYYSGGANSVRGWAESTLGPGTYQRDRTIRRGRDYNQIGDIKLDMNAEYRFRMFGPLNGALFLDAGNIWTVRPYDTQPGGTFRFDSFLGQLGVAYGLGLRLDFSFLVVRLDLGIKLHDPSLPAGTRWRTKPGANDFALHFAIGYPF